MKSKCECCNEPFNTCTCSTELKFSKPGPKKKKAKIWNKRPRVHSIEKPKDTYCRFCGNPDDGTAYFHHCEIPYLKMKYGSGTGRKIDDNLTVWAHHKCGTDMSVQPMRSTHDAFQMSQWARKWLIGIIETHLV